MSLKCYKNFVHGEYLANTSGKTFDVINPGTGEINYQVEEADERVLNAALKSSQEGFLKWSAMTGAERGRILNKAANLLRIGNDELAIIEVEDTGKPWQEASVVDVISGAEAIEFFAGLAASMEGNQQSLEQGFYYTRREPLGICLGIGAWNYPLQIACWKSAPALACGNSMVFKPSEETPLGALKLAEIFTTAGVPAGVFNVVLGAGNVGEQLTKDPRISKVSFTGEVSTGKKVMTSSAQSIREVTMELGGKSPLIIFEDANIEDAVSAAMLGNFYTQGEICTNGTRVFVHRAVYETFIEQLIPRIKENIVIGDPKNPNTNFGALISKEHSEKVLKYIEIGKLEGATLLHGGHSIKPENAKKGFFVEPTVFSNCTDDMKIVKEEIFGPVMSILIFDNEDEVITRANNTDFGLAAGVCTSDITKAHRVIHKLHAGICWINSYGNSPVEMPVGGYKHSGIGRENGKEAINQYSQLKSVYVGLSKIISPY